jgi:hypothetical protein
MLFPICGIEAAEAGSSGEARLRLPGRGCDFFSKKIGKAVDSDRFIMLNAMELRTVGNPN